MLLSPSRSGMEKMLRICEQYAMDTNLHFSTHPDPGKSKSKCIFMSGHMKAKKPLNLTLYGVDLPFVKTATHLGHQLSEDCTMEHDIKCRRAEFIGNSTEVREMFSFAQPNQILQAVRTYCCSMHNCMTWPLFSSAADQFFNCWSTCVKLAWRLDRATKTFFVDNLLAGGLPSLKTSVRACFSNFHQGVITSASLEVRVIACIAGSDLRSSTGSTLHNIALVTGSDPVREPARARQELLRLRHPVPAAESWRIPCLMKFLDVRHKQELLGEDTGEVEAIIRSLVTT